MTELYKKVKCPDCCWSEFKDEAERLCYAVIICAVGMTPCPKCNSTGYIFEPVEEE